jgi:VanZ family protein
MKLAKVAFYCALIAVSWLGLSNQSAPTITTGWDKTNHLLAFFTLYLLLDLVYPFGDKQKVALLVLYAVALECVQGLIPWRAFSLLDLVADFLGLLGYLAARALWRWQRIFPGKVRL